MCILIRLDRTNSSIPLMVKSYSFNIYAGAAFSIFSITFCIQFSENDIYMSKFFMQHLFIQVFIKTNTLVFGF